LAGVQFLKQYPNIDAGRIGLIGHSLGGLVAASMASQSTDIQYIISMASTGFWGRAGFPGQTINRANQSGVPKHELKKIKELCYRMYDLWMADTITTADEREFEEVYTTIAQYLSPDLREIYYPGPARRVLSYYRQPEVRKSLELGVSAIWRSVPCKVLLLKGSLDFNFSNESHQKIIDDLKKGGNNNVTSIILNRHNHHFQKCTSGSPSEVQSIDESISEKTLNIITDWILKNE
jgi:pimeloyl-ACP methyl ester carboxylesterase